MGKPTRGRGPWWRQAVNVKHRSPAGTSGRRVRVRPVVGWAGYSGLASVFCRPMEALALHVYEVDFEILNLKRLLRVA
jgi:hypothetical protein